MLNVLLLSGNATLPTRGSPLAAGADLDSAENACVPARASLCVKTDIAIVCPAEPTSARRSSFWINRQTFN